MPSRGEKRLAGLRRLLDTWHPGITMGEAYTLVLSLRREFPEFIWFASDGTEIGDGIVRVLMGGYKGAQHRK